LNPKGWADPDPSIREDDAKYASLFKKFNPVWLHGISRDENGEILHPYGRTGIRGQGVLGNRRVNEAVDPIVLFLDEKDKDVKVLLIKRFPVDTKDNSWAIPGGMVDYAPDTDSYTVPLRLGNLLSTSKVKAPPKLAKSAGLTPLVHKEDKVPFNDALRELKEETGFTGKVAYQKLLAQMYSDDVRNTDTTWISTSLFLLIADVAQSLTADGVETSEAKWVPFHEAMEFDFFASHRLMIVAAVRYYIIRSFHDRDLDGSPEHQQAYMYLRGAPDLELPDTFEGLLLLTE